MLKICQLTELLSDVKLKQKKDPDKRTCKYDFILSEYRKSIQ